MHEADRVFEHMFGDTCNRMVSMMILAALKAQLDTVIAVAMNLL